MASLAQVRAATGGERRGGRERRGERAPPRATTRAGASPCAAGRYGTQCAASAADRTRVRSAGTRVVALGRTRLLTVGSPLASFFLTSCTVRRASTMRSSPSPMFTTAKLCARTGQLSATAARCSARCPPGRLGARAARDGHLRAEHAGAGDEVAGIGGLSRLRAIGLRRCGECWPRGRNRGHRPPRTSSSAHLAALNSSAKRSPRD